MKKINQDDVFIYPTDTVWGIGCHIFSEPGYKKIAQIKRTSDKKPLSIMFSSVEEVMKYFSFPEEMNADWLKQFFALETTLGFPLKAAKVKIPKWATGESEFVSMRVLETATVSAIDSQLKAPFFTTSLNLTGEPPVTTAHEAEEFQKKYAVDTVIIDESLMDQKLSGTSSTIIFMKENLSFDIKREGRRIEEVKQVLSKLFDA